MKLHPGSIKTFSDLEILFLAQFFDDGSEVAMTILLETKQRKDDSVKAFIGRLKDMALMCLSGMTVPTLVQMCHIIFKLTKCTTWQQLKK